ncbi:MAG: hypothetical protein ABI351_04605 [Herbaspirillum sp.]
MAKIVRKFDVSVPKLDAIGRALVAEPLNWKVSKAVPQSRSCSAKSPVKATRKTSSVSVARVARVAQAHR